MSQIIFEHEGMQIQIQCDPKEKVSAVLGRFCIKVQKDKSNIQFLFNGSILNEQKNVEQLPKNSNGLIIVIANDTSSSNQSAQTKIKSKEVICPKCLEAATVSIDDEYKISIVNCRNNHETKNLNISEFDGTQMFDMSKVICDQCKEKNMSIVFNNQFYRCLNCKMNLCPLCKNQAHDSNHNIINFPQKNYICEEHGEPIIYYCISCKKKLCFSCEEAHNNHEIKDFRKLKKNNEDLEKEINKFGEYIDKAKQVVQEDIKNYADIWNKVMNNFEIIYRMKKDLFDIIKKNQRNYENLSNQEFIIKKFDNDFNEIINANDINDRYQKILNIYQQMETKNIFKEVEYTNILLIKYKKNKNDNNIKIFGNYFVNINKDKCKIIYKNKEYPLVENFSVNNNDDILEIKLTNINNISIASWLFDGCSSLVSLPDIFKWNTINVTQMVWMFNGCSSLISLPDISIWNTTNVTEMIGMFYGCSSLMSLPDISKWNTISVKDMRWMFGQCSSLKSFPDISKWNTANCKDKSGIFNGCSSLKYLPNIFK